jgi:metal-sulfur cluster biosynthetic enzyme
MAEIAERVDVALIREQLRSVQFPGFSGDIVAHGFVRGIDLRDGVVVVRFAPDTQRSEKVAEMVQEIRRRLRGLRGVREVRVERLLPFADTNESRRLMTPLQAELLEDGVVPEPDVLGAALSRADIAHAAGYGPEGPAEPDGPTLAPNAESGSCAIATTVFQWEIDPHDPARENGERDLVLDGWEFRVWWQVHPARLVYASIQAVRDDAQDERGARRHPVGRNVVVNLVYDLERDGVVAIYGTARDFRPFVEAFRRAFEL